MNKTIEVIAEKAQSDIFHWRAVVLIEALYLKALEQDPKKIARILKTSPTEIKSMLKKLATLGVIQRTKGGQYVKSAFYFHLSSADRDQTLKSFSKKMKRLSLRRILPESFLLSKNLFK